MMTLTRGFSCFVFIFPQSLILDFRSKSYGGRQRADVRRQITDTGKLLADIRKQKAISAFVLQTFTGYIDAVQGSF